MNGAIRESEQGRFERLLAGSSRIIHRVSHVYTQNPEDGKDLVQEIHFQAWRAFPAYDERRLFSTWLYRIALNVAISFARRNRQREVRSTPLDPELAGNSAQLEVDDRVSRLEALMHGLDELNRALLMLYLDERSHAEIAEILGISETNVATKLSRLRQKLRQAAAKGD